MKHHEVPEILIEQYVLGELASDKAHEIEQSPGFAERVAEIQRSNAEILDQYPPAQFVARIQNQYAAEESSARQSRERPARRPAIRWLAIALPGAVAVVAGVLIAVQGFFGAGLAGNSSELDDLVRIKGSGPELSVYRSLEGPDTQDVEAEELPDGARASAGDRLQLSYNAGEMAFGAIISVDGRGGVYTHFPLDLSSEPKLVVGRVQRLAFGYQLDDAPRFEHFYFITSSEAFSVQQLIQTVRSQANRITERADSLELDDKFEITSVSIIKGE
jgi:hypothetical protein